MTHSPHSVRILRQGVLQFLTETQRDFSAAAPLSRRSKKRETVQMYKEFLAGQFDGFCDGQLTYANFAAIAAPLLQSLRAGQKPEEILSKIYPSEEHNLQQYRDMLSVSSSDHSIYVAPSNITSAGMGLYARHDIAKDKAITTYTGKVLAQDDVPLASACVLQIGSGKFLDGSAASTNTRSPASFSNTWRSHNRIKYGQGSHTHVSTTNNARFSSSATSRREGTTAQVNLLSSKAIAGGKEILTAYGRNFIV
jgi:hypothetical protein